MGRKADRVRFTVDLLMSTGGRPARRIAAISRGPTHLHHPRNQNPTKELVLSIVGILIVIILILLAIYLFRRVF
jgi:hypothetical protein